MGNTNYISSIVKILEEPQKKILYSKVEVRAQFCQARNNDLPVLVNLVFWGKLGDTILNYYKPTDYLIVEGYVSIKNKQKLTTKNQFLRYAEITVLKVCPFLLDLNLNP